MRGFFSCHCEVRPFPVASYLRRMKAIQCFVIFVSVIPMVSDSCVSVIPAEAGIQCSVILTTRSP